MENPELEQSTPTIKQRKNVEDSLAQITAPIIDHMTMVIEQPRTEEELAYIQNELRRLSRFVKRIRKQNNQ